MRTRGEARIRAAADPSSRGRVTLFVMVIALQLAAAEPAAAKHHRDGGAKSGDGCVHLKTIEERVDVGVPEVSGLAAITGPAGVALYAVGDGTYRVARIDPARHPPHVDELDAGPAFAGSGMSSQWEAVADGGRGPCMLVETSGRVSCLDEKLGRIAASFALDTSAPPELAAAWAKDPNSRGEGMVLLRRGHLLLLKEKRPPLLVEFGPAGDAPNGFGPDAALPSGSTFDVPSSGTLVALAVWSFSDALQALVADGSDLAVGPDHRLYLLSDESRMLVRLERQLRPSERKVNADACWRLPKEIAHPEGLVIDGDMRPWVGVDTKKSDRPNVFRLDALDRQQ